MKVIANDRLFANEKSQLDPLESNGSSPLNEWIMGWCSHLQKCSSIYMGVLKLDQEIVQIPVPLIRQRRM